MTIPNAGWYPDPREPGFHRWWDGRGWTDQTRSNDDYKAIVKAERRQAYPASVVEGTRRVERFQGTLRALQEKQAQSVHSAIFRGLSLTDTEISYKGEGGPISGARARVDSAGEINRRMTVTRQVFAPKFARAFRKVQDHRELYLIVEGNGFAFTVPVEASHGLEARQLASKINLLGSRHQQSDAHQTAVTARAPTTAEEIEGLAELHRSGALSDGEFTAAKAKLLGI